MFGYENRQTIPNLRFKKDFERHVDSLMIEKESQSRYVLIKDFNTFIYNQTLHLDRKHFVTIFCNVLVLYKY